MDQVVPYENVTEKIHVIRGVRVILDFDIASMYEVETRVLKQAVRRNPARFPPDFMFELTNKEVRDLRSQIVISNRGGTRYPPMAFTEHGVAMLSGVLQSERAVLVNIEIMRAFTKLRRMLADTVEIREKLNDMEKRYDENFRIVFEAIRQLFTEEEKPKTKIGF